MTANKEHERMKSLYESARREAHSRQVAAEERLAYLQEEGYRFAKSRVETTRDGELTDWDSFDAELKRYLSAEVTGINSDWKLCMLNYFALLNGMVEALNHELRALIGQARVFSAQTNLNWIANEANHINHLQSETLLNEISIDSKGTLQVKPSNPNLSYSSAASDHLKRHVENWLKEEHGYTKQFDGTFKSASDSQLLDTDTFDGLKEVLIKELQAEQKLQDEETAAATPAAPGSSI